MAKYELKSLGILSVAKIYTVIAAIIGFFVGVLYAFIFGFAQPTGAEDEVFVGFMRSLAWFLPLIVAVMYGFMGFFIGLVGGWIYNKIALWTKGGIELELDLKKKKGRK